MNFKYKHGQGFQSFLLFINRICYLGYMLMSKADVYNQIKHVVKCMLPTISKGTQMARNINTC